MNRSILHQPDPKLDLVFERIVDVPRELIWTAWTTPAQLKKWFTPAPWKTVDCEIDLRPGGLFRTVMRSPEGQELLNAGCYLEIVETEKLVWTNALAPATGHARRRRRRPALRSSLPRSLRLSRMETEQGTRRSFFTATKKRARNTKRWDFTRVGEKRSTSSSRSSRKSGWQIRHA